MPWISRKTYNALLDIRTLANYHNSLVVARLARIERSLGVIGHNIGEIMVDVNQALDDLEAQTTAIEGAEDSAEHSFLKLADMIESLKSNQTDPGTSARIQAAADRLRTRAAALAAAVAAAPTDDAGASGPAAPEPA